MEKLIDAHSHLWLRQDTTWNGKPIRTLHNGRSIFLGEEVQMLPPFMIDGRNTAEVFLSNMDYALVSAAVIVQEFIDGLQNDYLEEVQRQHPDRFLTCGMCDFNAPDLVGQVESLAARGFRAMAIPAHRLSSPLNSSEMMQMFHLMEQQDMILSITLADSADQVAQMREVISECPQLRIATEFYPYPSAIRAIREAADLVGMDRLMWGSDYPRTITAITYRMSYDFILKSRELSDDDKRQFLGGNASHFYRFNNLVNLPYIKNMSE